jgi:hypothetical protein
MLAQADRPPANLPDATSGGLTLAKVSNLSVNLIRRDQGLASAGSRCPANSSLSGMKDRSNKTISRIELQE